MTREEIDSRSSFITILESYDRELANRLIRNSLAIYAYSELYEKTNNMSDIIFFSKGNTLSGTIGNKIGDISLGLSRELVKNLREVKQGVSVITPKGIYFFMVGYSMVMTIDEYGERIPEGNYITNYYFFPFEQLSEIKPSITKKILEKKCFYIRNIYSDSPNEDYYSYSLSPDYKEKAITVKGLLKVLAILLVIFVVQLFMLIIPNRNPFPYVRVSNATFSRVNRYTYRPHRTNQYQITFLEAYILTVREIEVSNNFHTINERDILIIDYDFTVLESIYTYRGEFRHNFSVYDSSGNFLEFWNYTTPIHDEYFIFLGDGILSPFILFHSDRNRYVLSARFGPYVARREVINAMMIVVPVDIPEYIRIVKYNQNFQMTFNHKIYVRHE